MLRGRRLVLSGLCGRIERQEALLLVYVLGRYCRVIETRCRRFVFDFRRVNARTITNQIPFALEISRRTRRDEVPFGSYLRQPRAL